MKTFRSLLPLAVRPLAGLMLLAAVALTTSLAIPSCGPEHKPKYSDTYSSGSIKVLVDESFAPLVNASLLPYTATYPQASLNISQAPEDSALRLLALDSVQLVIATRELNDREKEVMTSQGVKPIYIKVATDGLALVVHPSNQDSMLMDTTLKALVAGELKDWGQVSAGNKNGPIELVFDNANSANLSYLQRELKLSPESVKAVRITTADSNRGILSYVASHPGAIGFVASSWVYDTTRSVLGAPGVKVVGLAHKSNPERIITSDDYYQPYPAYIGDKSYPLRRDIYWIYRSGRTGLAMGYAAYMASDKGQRIVLKHGLFPANTPVRLVETTAKPLE